MLGAFAHEGGTLGMPFLTISKRVLEKIRANYGDVSSTRSATPVPTGRDEHRDGRLAAEPRRVTQAVHSHVVLPNRRTVTGPKDGSRTGR